MRNQLLVRLRSGVMKFVDDDVIEVIWREALQMLNASERLNRGEQDISIFTTGHWG